MNVLDVDGQQQVGEALLPGSNTQTANGQTHNGLSCKCAAMHLLPCKSGCLGAHRQESNHSGSSATQLLCVPLQSARPWFPPHLCGKTHAWAGTAGLRMQHRGRAGMQEGVCQELPAALINSETYVAISFSGQCVSRTRCLQHPILHRTCVDEQRGQAGDQRVVPVGRRGWRVSLLWVCFPGASSAAGGDACGVCVLLAHVAVCVWAGDKAAHPISRKPRAVSHGQMTPSLSKSKNSTCCCSTVWRTRGSAPSSSGWKRSGMLYARGAPEEEDGRVGRGRGSVRQSRQHAAASQPVSQPQTHLGWG